MPNEWLTQMLAKRPRGASKALADYLGYPSQAKISKMLKGEKGGAPTAIPVQDIVRMEEFFGELYPPMHRNYLRFAYRK